MTIKIALHSSYWIHNFGDDLLTMIYVQWIKEAAQGNQVVLPLASPETMRITGADYIGIRQGGSAEALIYGGGGYFGERPNRVYKWGFVNFLRHIPIGELMRLQQKPVAIIGVGAGPISNPLYRGAVVRMCRYANIVAVRDEESFEYLVEYGVPASHVIVTADAALTISKDEIPTEACERAKAKLESMPQPIKIAVHIPLSSEYANEQQRIIREVVDYAHSNPDLGIVWIRDMPSSPSTLESLTQLLPKQSIAIPYTEPWDLVALLGLVNVVLTTKMHVGVTATALGTPVIAAPWHPKVLRFYRQVGAEHNCIPINSFTNGGLVQKISEQLFRPSSPSLLDAAVERAWDNKRLIHKFLAQSDVISQKKV